jgi:predicted ArsR family transcriptional regulator
MGTQRRPATEAEARALASAIRLRILRLCLDQAFTNKEIANRLGENPATTLHHVRTLVATGFLEPQAERRGTRGAREVPYLATGKSWTLDVGDQPDADAGRAMIDAFVQEVGLVGDPAEVKLSRLGLRLTADEHDELVRRVTELLDELRDRAPSADARPYSLFVALHPDVGRE